MARLREGHAPSFITMAKFPVPFYNRTRRSSSIPQRLLKEGKWYLIPPYYFLLTSFLAKEAVCNSGSWMLADHIYCGKPRGRLLLGKIIDALLLSLPSAKSFRSRYMFIRDEVIQRVLHYGETKQASIHVLSVPSGIPRDLIEASFFILRRYDNMNGRMHFWGIDLDAAVFQAAAKVAREYNVLDHFSFVCKDAFDPLAYPKPLHIITSTGFGEFLSDAELEQFYTLCYNALEPEGTFLTTALWRHTLSDFLLREFAEIHTHYRTADMVQPILKRAGFKKLQVTTDKRGLQAFFIAQKV